MRPEVVLPARVLDQAAQDQLLVDAQPMVGCDAGVGPVAAGGVALTQRANRRETATVAFVVGGELPVKERDQIMLFQRGACHDASLAQQRRRDVEEDQAGGLRATIVENAFLVPPRASKLCCRASSIFQGAKRRSSSSRPKRQ